MTLDIASLNDSMLLPNSSMNIVETPSATARPIVVMNVNPNVSTITLGAS